MAINMFSKLFKKTENKTIFLYNTLSRTKEEFRSIKKGYVGMYTCGPTVYGYPHLGNLRTYVFEDVLKRVLQKNGYKVNHIMNITDVGHLTNDRDMGEDKVEREAQKTGKTAWEIADFYTKIFKEDIKNLNIIFPNTFCKATDNIKEQIEMIQTLEKKGFTYKTTDGIYFDTSKVSDYTKLSGQNLEALREGARVEINDEKRNPTDFALWKFSKPEEKRQMEWQSPWGVGFPGWHIECSAMSVKYLGEQFDIHCGATDAISLHHTNEIAQTEAATDKKPWVNFWIHGGFLNMSDGKKMAKSSGDKITLNNTFIEKGSSPLVYRFATFSTHYRKPMEWGENIASAKQGLDNLYSKISNLGTKVGKVNTEWRDRFMLAINDDLNMSQALAVLNEMLKSEISKEDKLATVYDFDEVLGLEFKNNTKETKADKIPDEVQRLVDERTQARKGKDWAKSDELRDKIKELGYEVKDTAEGIEIKKI
jgi:cysteinyl-tRNA synthetase